MGLLQPTRRRHGIGLCEIANVCLRSCLSGCKGVESPAKRSYVGLVAVGVQEQAEDFQWGLLVIDKFSLEIRQTYGYLPSGRTSPPLDWY